jgi:hypothetical protein
MTMSSSDSVLEWERRWTEARLVRRVRADPAGGRRRLELAEVNVRRAKREQTAGDSDAALIFAEQALINAADVLLSRDGYSVNSHVVRFSYPRLPNIYVSEAIRLAERALGEVRAAL